jgi:hypothetical protein
MIALIVIMVLKLISFGPTTTEPIIIPPMPSYSPAINEAQEWAEYEREAYDEYAEEFTKLFKSYETKRASNGAMLIRRGNSGKYSFAKRGQK